MAANNEQVLAFLKDPENFLYSLDLQKGQFEFITTTRSKLADLSFLDQRTLGQVGNRKAVPAPVIIQQFQANPLQFSPGQANYLFHTSFCCSTMMARCLDVPGKNLSLKEPLALLGLAAFKKYSPNFNASDPGWRNLRDITLFFLSRSFQGGEKILFKPSNGANIILPEILDFPQTGKILLLYNDLESFLGSVLNGGKQRIASVLPLFDELATGNKAALPAGVGDLNGLRDLQKMALFWGLQMQSFQETMNLNNSQKIKTMNYTEFLQGPEETLEKLVHFYNLGFSKTEQAEILKGPAFNAHSKDQGVGFSADQNMAEREKIVKIFETEIKEAVTWIKALGLDFRGGLSNPL